METTATYNYGTATALPDPRIVVNETIDGAPGGDAVAASTAAKKRKRTAAKTAKTAKASKQRADTWIWGIYIALLLFSIIGLFSASATQVKVDNVYDPLIRHGKFLVMGIVIIFCLKNVHYKWFRKYAVPFAIVSFAMLVYSFFFGININGAQRSFSLLGFVIQPAEIVKLACMVLLAFILAKNQMSGGVTNRGVILSSIVILLFTGFTYRNGLTNTALLMGVALSMMVIGGIQWRKLFIVIGIFFTIIFIFNKANDYSKDLDKFNTTGTEQVAASSAAPQGVDRTETRKGRMADFLEGVHPGDPITDANRQVVFSRYAQANGGIIGRGPGNNREGVRLPLAFSDYIYSIIVEDSGLAGGIILLLLYLGLLGRAGYIASKCSRAFPALLIMGCAVMIVFQAIIHMAINVGIVPVSGQPLPLISMGGTSIIVMSMAIGIMLSVSRFAVTNKNTKKEINAEIADLPEDIRTENPTQI